MNNWIEIPEYPDYKINTYGKITRGGKIRKPYMTPNGYLRLPLSKNGKVKMFSVHQLVAISFLGHKPNGGIIVIDHIDNNKLNNNVKNLRVVTQRENCYTHYKGSSKHKGVSWHKGKNKWQSRIYINGKTKYLGTFKNELEASKAYQKALS